MQISFFFGVTQVLSAGVNLLRFHGKPRVRVRLTYYYVFYQLLLQNSMNEFREETTRYLSLYMRY